VRHTIAETAAYFQLDPTHVQSILSNSRKALLVERNARPRPHLDDKIITAWNGLMISAFAKGYAVLGKIEYLTVHFLTVSPARQKQLLFRELVPLLSHSFPFHFLFSL
jgi:uncharacterized protein YyaL (SSP411 family)